MENDLIRRSDAIQAFDELLKSPYANAPDSFSCGVKDALKLARDMMRSDAPKSLSIPAVDAVEVVHSWWEDCSNGWSCGKCHYDTSKEYPYCPHCGARMDGRREDGDKT